MSSIGVADDEEDAPTCNSASSTNSESEIEKSVVDKETLVGLHGGGTGTDLEDQISLLQQLPSSIKEALAEHKWAAICYDPLRFIIAHTNHKQILRSVVETRTIKHKDETFETVHELKLTDVIIGAIPTDMTVFENPLGYTEYKYRINFITTMDRRFAIGPKPLESIISELREKALIYSTYSGEEALVAIINAFDKSRELKVNNDVDTPGFYLIEGRIKSYNTNHPMPSPVSITKCVELLDILQTKYNRKEIFPTIIRWAIITPFNYVLKQINGMWIPWLHLYGWPNTGKSAAGDLTCAVWGFYLDKTHKVPYTNLDTVAKFGEALSKGTYPITVNEVGGLGEDKQRPLLEMFKTAIEGMIARSKFIRKTHYTEIPAYCACILTGNLQPPTDPGYRRRVIPISFTQRDEHTEEERAEFEKLMRERVSHELKILGDFAANYILNNQEQLILDAKMGWKEVSKMVITQLYMAAGRDSPQWVNYFVEETQLTDSKEDVELILRAFFLNRVNEMYNRYYRNIAFYPDNDAEVPNLPFLYRLNFCLTHHLIPFLNPISKSEGRDEIVITSDLMQELRQLKMDWSVSNLAEIATLISGFNYGQKKFRGRNIRAAYGSKTKFLEFLDLD